MNLTVAEALNIFPLSKGKLVAGATGVTRVIRSLNLMDAPDIWNWIKPGEMLFSTAFAIRDSTESFLLLLQKLDERGSAGLGIKLGRYWKQIPREVIEEADRLQFPLIELPFEFTFSDQINALFEEQFERNTRKLHNALETQKKLMHFAMETSHSANPFQQISDILGHPLVVIGARGQILHNRSDWPEAELLADWPWLPQSKRTRTESGWAFRIPLVKNEECFGFLLVMPKHGPESQEEEGLFHQAAVILSYHMETLQEQQPSVVYYRLGEAIERFLQRLTPLETVLDLARAVRGRIWSGSYACVLTTLKPELKNQPHLSRKLNQIRREIQFDPNLSALESHHLFVHNDMLSLFALPEQEGGASAELIGKYYLKMIGPLHEGAVQCYISKTKYSLDELPTGYDECIEAKRIGERLSYDSPVILFSDLEFTYLLRHIPRETMRRYCDYALHNLMQKDADYVSEMLRTLDAYFSHNGQINDAAKQLFVHRNTVLYRLEKISELLKIDFHNIDDLLHIKLVLMFRQLLRMEAGGE